MSGIKIEEYAETKTYRIEAPHLVYHAEVKYYKGEPVSIILKKQNDLLAILRDKEKEWQTIELGRNDVVIIMELAKKLGWIRA